MKDMILTFMKLRREACKIHSFNGFEPLPAQNQITALNSMLLHKTRLQINTNNK